MQWCHLRPSCNWCCCRCFHHRRGRRRCIRHRSRPQLQYVCKYENQIVKIGLDHRWLFVRLFCAAFLSPFRSVSVFVYRVSIFSAVHRMFHEWAIPNGASWHLRRYIVKLYNANKSVWCIFIAPAGMPCCATAPLSQLAQRNEMQQKPCQAKPNQAKRNETKHQTSCNSLRKSVEYQQALEINCKGSKHKKDEVVQKQRTRKKSSNWAYALALCENFKWFNFFLIFIHENAY